MDRLFFEEDYNKPKKKGKLRKRNFKTIKERVAEE